MREAWGTGAVGAEQGGEGVGDGEVADHLSKLCRRPVVLRVSHEGGGWPRVRVRPSAQAG